MTPHVTRRSPVSDRTWTRHPTSTGIGGVCAHCGLRSPPGSAQGALLPDATVIDPQDRGRDGRRYVIACGTEHLQVLIDRARRDWVAEQLWFGLLCRASTPEAARGVPVADLASRARLSPEHLRRAVDWNTRSNNPRVTLPGGQTLPNRDTLASATQTSERLLRSGVPSKEGHERDVVG